MSEKGKKKKKEEKEETYEVDEAVRAAEFDAEMKESDADLKKKQKEILGLFQEVKDGLTRQGELLGKLEDGDLMDKMHIETIQKVMSVIPADMRGSVVQKVVEKLADRVGKKAVREWKHPIHVEVVTSYHRCGFCDRNPGDEVVVVVERLRTGDRINVFCDLTCLTHHEWEE